MLANKGLGILLKRINFAVFFFFLKLMSTQL